jgi:hypothetical protein
VSSLAAERIRKNLERGIIAARKEETAFREGQVGCRRRATNPAPTPCARLDPVVEEMHREQPLAGHAARGNRPPLSQKIDRSGGFRRR